MKNPCLAGVVSQFPESRSCRRSVTICILLLLHSTSTRSRPSLMTSEGEREWRTRASQCEVMRSRRQKLPSSPTSDCAGGNDLHLIVDPKPAAVGVAADYKTHADFLYLIMVPQVSSIPPLTPVTLSFNLRCQKRPVGRRATLRTTAKVQSLTHHLFLCVVMYLLDLQPWINIFVTFYSNISYTKYKRSSVISFLLCLPFDRRHLIIWLLFRALNMIHL